MLNSQPTRATKSGLNCKYRLKCLLGVSSHVLVIALAKWKGAAASYGPLLPHLPKAMIVTVAFILPSTDAIAQFVADGVEVNASNWSVHTDGNSMPGLSALNGGTIQADNTNPISTKGTSSHGAFAETAGTINLSNSTLITTGNSAYGIYARTDGKITLTDSTITTSGLSTRGVIAEYGGYVSLLGSSVTTTARSAIGVMAQGGRIDISDTTVTTDGVSAFGLYADGAGSMIDATAVTVKTIGTNAHGVQASTGGTITLTGAKIDTSGQNAAGIWAHENNSRISGSATINTQARNAHGAYATSGGNIDVAGSITTNGNSARGLYATGTGSMLTSSANVTTWGDTAAHGAQAHQGATIELSGGSFETNGASSNGLHVSIIGSKLTAENVAVVTNGKTSYGIFAEAQGQMSLTNAMVTTTGYGSYGIRATDAGSYVLGSNVGISTTGDGAYGAMVHAGAAMDLTGGWIKTSGTGSVGLWANAGTINATNIDISTTGAGADGVQASVNSTLNFTGGSVSTAGDSARGLTVSSNSTLTASDTIVETIGADAHAAYLTNDGSLIMNGSSLIAQGVGAGGLGFGQLGGTNTLATATLINVSIVSQDGISIFAEKDTSGILTFDHVEAVINNGRLLDIADNASLAISAAASHFRGDAFTASTGVSSLSLTDSSVWTITGNSNLTNLTNDGSTIAFSAPDNDQFKTLTVHGDYTSNDGSFVLNARLGDDASPTDRLIFNGDVFGTSKVAVNNAGGLGAQTIGDGIQLIDAEKASEDAFEQNGRISAGAYDYTLFAGGKAGEFNGDWYLRSTYVGTEVPETELPNYRPEVPLAMVAPALASRFGLAMLGTYNDRQGARAQKDSNVWIRLFGESGDIGSNGGSDQDRLNDFYRDGPSYSYKLGGIQFGVDVYRGETQAGSQNIGGLYAGIGRAEADVNRVYGGDAGTTTLNGYSLGGYWTHLNNAGWYTDLVLQGTRFDPIRTDSTGNVGMRTQGWAATSSLEAGYKLRLADGWGLEPQAQLIYQHVSLDNTEDRFGQIDFDATNTVYGRIGARLTRDWTAADGRIYSAWARANLWHTMSGDATTTFADLSGNNRVALNSDLGGTWGQLGLGISAQLKNNVSLFANGDYSHSLGNNGARSSIVSGNVGLKVKW